MDLFTGTGVALVTPFDEAGNIDEVSLRRLVNYVLEGGVDYLVALGTTSEAATLSVEERIRVLEIIVDENRDRVPVMVGIGGNNTAEVIRTLHSFPLLSSCQGILSVTPYYNKPSQEGMYRHFREIAEQRVLPVFLYNVPGRTGINLEAKTVIRLSNDCPNILGIKEASGNFSQVGEILSGCREGFRVVSGDDGITLPLMAVGVTGVISVIANVCPREFSELVRLAIREDYRKAANVHLRLGELFKALFAEGNPAGIKAALHAREVIRFNTLRLPLTPVSDDLYKGISGMLKKI